MKINKRLFLFAFFYAFCLAVSGSAHVQLNSPDGGEIYQPEDLITIEWQVLVQHATENWDLAYSITGADGPWIEIISNIPVGDPGPGAKHTYQWTAPDISSTEVRVRATQDNSGTDYVDFSNSDFIIQSPPPPCCENTRGNANSDPEDNTNVSDVTFLVAYLFGIPSGPTPQCAEEANANGDPGENVNISDITFLISYLFGIPSGPAPAACP